MGYRYIFRRAGTTLGLLLVLLGMVAPAAHAQRHDRHMTGLALTGGGTSDQQRYAEFSWLRYVTDKTSVRVGLSLARPQGLGLRELGSNATYGLTLALAPTLFRIREAVYVHVVAGGLLRYERTQVASDDLHVTATSLHQHVAGGPMLGVEADLFLLNRLSLVGSVQQSVVFPGDGLTNWPGYYGVGLRYYIF